MWFNVDSSKGAAAFLEPHVRPVLDGGGALADKYMSDQVCWKRLLIADTDSFSGRCSPCLGKPVMQLAAGARVGFQDVLIVIVRACQVMNVRK